MLNVLNLHRIFFFILYEMKKYVHSADTISSISMESTRFSNYECFLLLQRRSSSKTKRYLSRFRLDRTQKNDRSDQIVGKCSIDFHHDRNLSNHFTLHHHARSPLSSTLITSRPTAKLTAAGWVRSTTTVDKTG